jgi:hypothetical protein
VPVAAAGSVLQNVSHSSTTDPPSPLLEKTTCIEVDVMAERIGAFGGGGTVALVMGWLKVVGPPKPPVPVFPKRN